MTTRKDVLFKVDENEVYDLHIANGDFVIGVSDVQHVRHILEAEKGQYKQFPLIGAAIRRAINAAINSILFREVGIQLKSDGYTDYKITSGVDKSTLKIEL